jgi:hypothetical protein
MSSGYGIVIFMALFLIVMKEAGEWAVMPYCWKRGDVPHAQEWAMLQGVFV